MPRQEPAAGFTFHLIPHTHWDREWYLPRAAWQARLVPMLDGALAQLERDRDARFVLDGQTVLLEDYLAVQPDHQARVSAQVRRGALETGPWYVLSDLLIPSAASLRRNLREGARDSDRLGRRLPVLYSPDAFGHPAELPALAAEADLRWAVVRRGLGRPGGRDRDLYRWKAPGGKSLLVYHLPAAGYDLALELADPDRELAPAWAAIRRELVERAVTGQIAIFLGADHHGMADHVTGIRDRLRELEPENEVRVSGLAEFFEAIEKVRPHPPELLGELRQSDGHAWLLQGVHSTRSRMKRRHARSELALSRIAEPLAELSTRAKGADRQGLLRLAWRTLLQCQFHDTLAGTTSDAVQREQAVRLDAVDSLAGEIAAASLAELAGYDADLARDRPEEHPSRLVLWNPGGNSRDGIATAELSFFRGDLLVGSPSSRVPRSGAGYQPCALDPGTGEMIPVQVLAVRGDQRRVDAPRHYPDQDEVDRVWVAFQPPVLPPRALCSLVPRPGALALADQQLQVSHGFLANRFVTVRVSRGGSLALEDRRTGERYAELCELTDESDRGDLYTFSRGSGRPVRGGRPLTQAIIAAGPLVGAIETRWTMRSASEGEIEIRQVVALYADSPVLRIRLDLVNEARDHRLRARFPVGAGVEVLAGTALGSIRRRAAQGPGDADVLERSVTTAPAHRYVAAGSRTRGLAVLAADFFEYEWSAGRELEVTLLRSVGELSRNDLPERPGHAAWPMPAPEAQEEGLHTIALALTALDVFEGDLVARLERMWEDVCLPTQAAFLGRPVGI